MIEWQLSSAFRDAGPSVGREQALGAFRAKAAHIDIYGFHQPTALGIDDGLEVRVGVSRNILDAAAAIAEEMEVLINMPVKSVLVAAGFPYLDDQALFQQNTQVAIEVSQAQRGYIRFEVGKYAHGAGMFQTILQIT